jgi:Kef-type K+ transport system membrane component KefB
VTGALAVAGFVQAFVPIAIGLTTTALGTLPPILRDNRLLDGRFGGLIMAAGAVGEFLPIVATAIFSSARKGAVLGLISLTVIAGIAVLFTLVPRLVRQNKLVAITAEGEHATSQTTLRWTMFLLFALLVIAADFGLDVVLGAFLAGVVLRRWAPGDVHALEGKLDAVGYGFVTPVFFVTSGMSLHLQSIIESPAGGLPRHIPHRPWPAGPAVQSTRAAAAWPGTDDAADRHRPAATGGPSRNRR